MTATDSSHVWMTTVAPEVAALSTEDAKALVVGSSFARRMKATEPEHGSRMCDHGVLRGGWNPCRFCEAGLPPV